MINLDTNILNISRIGKTTAKRLENIGINTVNDLLYYFPYRYDDFRNITAIDKLIAGTNANIIGKIELIQNKRSPRRKMYITEALVSDESESIKIIWFNQPFIAKNLRVGDTVSFAGKVEGNNFDKSFISPIYEKITYGQLLHTNRLVPNYHLTANITQKQIRFLIMQIIPVAKEIADWLPPEIIKSQGLISLCEAIKKIHFPNDFKDVEKAKARLAFDEIFLIQMQSQLIKNDLEAAQAEKLLFFENETKKFVSSLPFQLTNSQRKTAWKILQDMEKDRPMARLLEGDVGSGKTLVAIIAMLNAVLNKKQAVLMAPTEILAKQHFNTINKLLNKFNIHIGLITSSEKKLNYELKITPVKGQANYELKKKKKKKIEAQDIINNSQIIIGTHALIQESIKFTNLALAIIDEQHRFGVEQRKELIKKANIVDIKNTNKITLMPHLLSMTATPIPRTLALTLYGDLDLSVITEMPKGRKQIITKIVPEQKRGQAYQFIKQEIKKGRQVFVICPLIDISDKLGVKSVKEEFIKLDKDIFPDIKIGLLHGRMKARDKEEVMNNFIRNEIKILVTTSVVEVGVDVPNAAIMMIEGADRFGLAQLHQFRGRVGRSQHQSYCFLFTENDSDKTMERLKAMENCFDGFTLAKMDLKFRGPGEVYGTAQKGFPELKIASLFDYQLIKKAYEEAKKLISQDKNLINHPLLKEELSKFEKEIHLE
jgi:ATP-dependent DNA helicase RecG